MIEQILRPTHWYLDNAYFNGVGMHALRLIEHGKSLDYLKTEVPIRTFTDGILNAESADWSFRVVRNQQGEKVALIPLHGAMTKYGGFCSYGTADLAEMVDAANEIDEIKGILFDIDCPGGAGDSIEVLDRAIQASEKPIVGYVDRLCASAAQWVAASIVKSGGKIIVDSLNNSTMGSIGSYIMYQNIVAQLEKDGIKVEIIRAPQSKDKVKFNSLEELTDEIRAEIKEDLKHHTNIFITQVKEYYGDRLNAEAEKLFTGGTFRGDQAIEIGLADSQGTITDAFNEVLSLSKSNQTQSIYKNDMNMFKRLGLSFSIAQKLSAEEIENLSGAADKLAEAEKLTEQNGTLTKQLETVTNEKAQLVTDHEAAIKALEDEKAEMQAKLDKTPAAAATTATSANDETAAEEAAEEAKKYETSVDRELAQIKSNLKVQK